MKVRTVNTVEGFKALEPAWRKLQSQCSGCGFFNGFDFNFVWWEVFGQSSEFSEHSELAIDVVESENGSNAPSIVAIAPLYRTQSQLTRLFKLPTLRFIGRGADIAPDDLDVLLCSDQILATEAVKILHAHWGSRAGVQRLLFEELPEKSQFYTLFIKEQPAYLVENRQSRPVASLPDSWSGFTSNLSRNSRKRIKNRRNRLNEANTFTLAVCETLESKQKALASLIDLHKMRLTVKGLAPAFSSVDYIMFHETLIKTLHQVDGVLSVTLSDGDKVVGVEYMYCYNGALLFNQTGFDPKYESVSPGHNMMVYAIETAIQNGFKKIDLLKGDYPYKRSYASEVKHSLMVSSYRSWHWRALAYCLNAIRSFKN